MRVLHNNVLALPIPEPEKTKSGLFLPKTMPKKNLAKVSLIGNKVKFVQVGDIIKYHEHTGVEVEYKGKAHLFLKEEHQIVAVI